MAKYFMDTKSRVYHKLDLQMFTVIQNSYKKRTIGILDKNNGIIIVVLAITFIFSFTHLTS